VTLTNIMPRRSRAIPSYLRQTRALAALAGLAVVAGIVSDILVPGFWRRHALIAGMASSLLVVMLTVAVVNEALKSRSRRRWSVLAHYVMLQLVRHARMVWMGIAELSGNLPSGALAADSIEAGARAIRESAQFADSVRGLVTDHAQLRPIQDALARMVEYGDEVLGRWADVMLNADPYAELVDQHVELASEIAWLQAWLDNFEPPDDWRRHRRARAHPAAQYAGKTDDEFVADRLLAIARLAERLDDSTLERATQLVPRDWWRARLSAHAQDPDDRQIARSVR
jgi:hypothetical protein